MGCTRGLLLSSLLCNLCDLRALCGETQFGSNGPPQRTQRAQSQSRDEGKMGNGTEGCNLWRANGDEGSQC
jgi:hypothetical protein